MLGRWFGSGRRSNRAITETLYGEIVAAARQPMFYSRWGVPDTPIGRFEMLCLHMFLFLHRIKDEPAPARDVAQELTDGFFRDMDHSLRELGVGDQGVPRRMKKLARMFYGRAMAYGAALDKDDRAALAEALLRNVQPAGGRQDAADSLASYAFTGWTALRGQEASALLSGNLSFPYAHPEEASA